MLKESIVKAKPSKEAIKTALTGEQLETVSIVASDELNDSFYSVSLHS